jgi:hypothetical protein
MHVSHTQIKKEKRKKDKNNKIRAKVLQPRRSYL